MSGLTLGIDIGGTNIKFGVVDQNNQIIYVVGDHTIYV